MIGILQLWQEIRNVLLQRKQRTSVNLTFPFRSEQTFTDTEREYSWIVTFHLDKLRMEIIPDQSYFPHPLNLPLPNPSLQAATPLKTLNTLPTSLDPSGSIPTNGSSPSSPNLLHLKPNMQVYCPNTLDFPTKVPPLPPLPQPPLRIVERSLPHPNEF